MTDSESGKFEILLDHLKRSRGFDFHGYKRSTLTRRVMKRMQTIGIADTLDYLDFLEVHPEEFTLLFNTILINVTSFFRDGPAWEYLGKEVIPQILKSKGAGGSIRVWSAGCASGEEIYSLVMLLAEAMGTEEFSQRVKVYATDADEEALNLARQGIYSEKDVRAVPADLREKYFKRSGSGYLFRNDLRRSIVFGSHNLVQDAPISRLDLLICRNTLMYLNAETQDKILARFHFALNENGFLFLGKAEMLLSHTSLFTPVGMPYRIFMKNFPANLRERLLALAQTGIPEADDQSISSLRLRELAFEAGAAAQVIIDTPGTLALANERARLLFNLSSKDLGRPLQDLELSYRPVELRSILEKVSADHHPVKLTNIERFSKDSEPCFLDVEIRPLKENGNSLSGFSVTYEDVTARQKAQMELQHTNLDLQALSEELESAHEELETANEELQSTNEELETTNEELQATNEELETMNEELHSTNEELETLNDELRERTDEINHANAFLQSILGGLHSGVMVVDRQLNLLLWNRQAEELWGLRSEEVLGKSIMNLDIGLPSGQIPLLDFLAGTEKYKELTLPATNRRGKAFQCHIICTPYLSLEGDRQGMVLVMEER
jgi:two-component system, chemotaxis family, CheB/CheR fusion protein